MLENSVRTDWPPYDIEKKGEHEYRITMAIAGFSENDVELTQHGPELMVTGHRKDDPEKRLQVLHRGMASRNFKQVFRLADHMKVVGATLENGLLAIELVREIPEELKPRRISITSTAGSPSVATDNREQIEQDVKPGRKAA